LELGALPAFPDRGDVAGALLDGLAFAGGGLFRRLAVVLRDVDPQLFLAVPLLQILRLAELLGLGLGRVVLEFLPTAPGPSDRAFDRALDRLADRLFRLLADGQRRRRGVPEALAG
jgi:hypothetical protein